MHNIVCKNQLDRHLDIITDQRIELLCSFYTTTKVNLMPKHNLLNLIDL